MTEDERVELRRKLRGDLVEWIDAHLPEILDLCECETPPELPIVEDFRLLLAISNGADPYNSLDYYPSVDSGTALHRLMGLVHNDLAYLDDLGRAEDD